MTFQKRTLLAAAAALIALCGANPLQAQSEAYAGFVEKQFYGNRIQTGSILLNGSFQHTGFENPDVDGFTGRAGFGLGFGLTENVAFTFGFLHQKSQVSNTFAVSTVETNTVQVGVRFLPNTVAGFVQPYVGLEYFTSNQGNQRQGGAIVPVGVIFWISNFMSVSLQPFSFVLAGDTGDAEEYNARFNVDLEMLNPTFGISFLFNARKP